MRKTVAVLIAAALALTLLLPCHALAEEQSFQVIVNDSNASTTLSKDDVARLMLKKTSRWDNGSAVLPIDLPRASRVREDFSEKVLGKSATAVEALWRQKIFSGAAVPPVEKGSDDEVVAYVRANAGAIGYVSKGAVLSGVKAVGLR